MANGLQQSGGGQAHLIQVEPGGCSETLASPCDRGEAVLVIVDGVGSVLTGDVWLEVGPGNRVTIEPGEPIAVKARADGPVVAVLVGRNSTARRAA